MIPDLVIIKDSPWKVLPQGIHLATADEVKTLFAYNKIRARLFAGLEKGMSELKQAGCKQIFLDGSYTTEKPNPNDYDLCWDPIGVNPQKLDPIIWHPQFMLHPRSEQQLKYLGDYFPAILQEGVSGKTFLDFFQVDRHGGQPKGILKVEL